MELADRILQMTPSGTLAMAQKTRELQRAGKDIINLTTGEPDFATPSFIKEKAIEAIQTCDVDHYIATAGLPALKEAICTFHNEKDHTAWQTEQVAVFTGAKLALYLAFQALVGYGDEVIIPSPYWVSYTEQVRLAQATPVLVTTTFEEYFKVTVDQLEEVTTSKTKVFVLTSPSNPTGALYTSDELKAIIHWAKRHDIVIVADEIYYELLYGDATTTSIATVATNAEVPIVVINGLSKSVAMTGWRVGYVLGPVEIVQAMVHLASHVTGNSTVVAQYAALAAFSKEAATAKEMMRQQFEQRLDTFYPLVAEIPFFKVHKPQAAFYLFVNAQQTAKKCRYNSVDMFVQGLLEEGGVAVVAGSNFGEPNYLRLSFASNEADLIEAAKRMRIFVERKLQK